MKERFLIILLCATGIVSVSYGMIKDNDIIFVIGIIFVISGYVIIRKRLKKSIREKDIERRC
jgi:hypothetical protein